MVSWVAASVLVGVAAVLAASAWVWWRQRSAPHPVGQDGFSAWELQDVSARLAEVERQFERDRLGMVSAQLGAAQSRLAAIRPLEASRWGVGPHRLVRVALMFEGQVELSGVVDAREVAQFMPLVRSGRVPRVSAVEMLDEGVVMVFLVDPEDGSPPLRLMLVEPRLA